MTSAPRRQRLLCLLLLLPLLCPGADIKPPRVYDPRLEISLIASEPEIVTPIGIASDRRGRIYVVESHTHLPATNYPGPKSDRIKVWRDTNGDGRPDQFSVFAEGFYHAMNLAVSPDDHVHVVHRNGIVRLEDRNEDGVSDGQTVLIQQVTRGDYPHNGLGGIAFGPDGWLYFGQGENMGLDYTLRGTDGRQVRGGGEGGNVYRCRPDGSHLERFATGFWNPFGLGWYGRRFLLAVDNDPDSRPPNRLLDVVWGGDYGFKYRFGRDGLHPYQSWNGELPGTLPMICGTGEGACALLACDQTRLPHSYHDALLVTASWEHQIELYRPKRFGASLRSDRTVLVQGDENFRPVGLTSAPDGALYLTDWVDVSYNVHRKGRLWRLATRSSKDAGRIRPIELGANAARRKMESLRSSTRTGKQLAGLTELDPFVRDGAITGLARPSAFEELRRAVTNSSVAGIRLGALLALRRAGFPSPEPLLERALGDSDEAVRKMALVWVGEARLNSLSNRLAVALSAGPVSQDLLRTHAATVALLAGAGLTMTAAAGARVLETTDASATPWALATLRAPSSKTPGPARLDAVRRLGGSPTPEGWKLLQGILRDTREEEELRAEAVVALGGGGLDRALAIALLDDAQPSVRLEAARALRGLAGQPEVTDAVKRKLARATDVPPGFVDALRFLLPAEGGAAAVRRAGRPGSDEAWRAALVETGSIESGRRLFFNATLGCSRCHRIEEYGGHIGPDLSTIARGADRERLLQSILHPSRDIPPQFVSHEVTTRAGQTLTGLLLGQASDGAVTLLTAEGRAVLVPGREIASHTQSTVSLMPEGLEQGMTVPDLRDLMAFLLSRK